MLPDRATPHPHRQSLDLLAGIVLDVPWTWQRIDDEAAADTVAGAVLADVDGTVTVRLVWLPAAVESHGRGAAGVHAAAVTALRRAARTVLGRTGIWGTLADGSLLGRRADGDGAFLWVRGFTAERRGAGLLVARSAPGIPADLMAAVLRSARLPA